MVEKTAEAEPVVRLRAARFGYVRDEPVITGFDAALLPGRLTVLIGPNAAGKSTLMKLMLGQLEPDDGEVLLGDRPVVGVPPHERAAAISYVPQRAGVAFAFTVEQVVAMGRYALRDDPAAVERAIEACELEPLRHRVCDELSVGQQQRVLLARAMAQAAGEGRAMLLDEPGSAMDLLHAHHMMRSLADLARSGLAVMAVLHDVNLAARYADEVWLMQDGRLVTHGPWADVLDPGLLEPVYRVRFKALRSESSPRPVFLVEPDARLE